MTYSMALAYATPNPAKFRVNVMRLIAIIAAAVIGITGLAPADAERPRPREQDEAWRGTKNGRLVPLRAIEARIVPQMRGFTYLGPELDAGAGRYRLKFLRGRKLVWIDIDARTGSVIEKFGF